MTPKIRLLIDHVHRRAVLLEELGLTPWRVEVGEDWFVEDGEKEPRQAVAREIWGLPVQIVDLPGYFRVAYKEWWMEQPMRTVLKKEEV
jgi:hypothetical protein